MVEILIVDTYYPAFLNGFYSTHRTESLTYQEHKKLLMDQLFGTADFYSENLKRLDCPACEIIFNDLKLQNKWALERGIRPAAFTGQRFTGYLSRFFPGVEKKGYYRLLKEQIEYSKPEILYIQDMDTLDTSFLASLKSNIRLIIGQIAYPLSRKKNLKCYDLILTSFPHFVKKFKGEGLRAEYFKLAFETSVLKKLEGFDRSYDFTFVGGLSKAHKGRTELIEKLFREGRLDFWGYGSEYLPATPNFNNKYHGEAWGKKLYEVLAKSKITLNTHIDIAKNYANNMRLYEATGCGTLLITDYKTNLGELFEIGKEILSFKSCEELSELVIYYSEHEKERECIARAGQKRTLKENSYFSRMKELLEIISVYS